jgi:hypothetical protein
LHGDDWRAQQKILQDYIETILILDKIVDPLDELYDEVQDHEDGEDECQNFQKGVEDVEGQDLHDRPTRRMMGGDGEEKR